MTFFSRFSNSPLTPAPACSSPRSRQSSRTLWSASGTLPSTMRRARPSTTAVLPTPGSPTTIGLFLRRRVRMSMIMRISSLRPSTGSISPAAARSVRSMVKLPRLAPAAVGPAEPGPPDAPEAAGASPSTLSTEPATSKANRRRSSSRGRASSGAKASPANSGAISTSASSRAPERIRLWPKCNELASQPRSSH